MSTRPKNKNEYREELAESFAHVLEEKGLNWKKEWRGSGRGAPFNGITKAAYVSILDCSEVTATSYLKRMEDDLKIIVPVEGMGKGKYKFSK